MAVPREMTSSPLMFDLSVARFASAITLCCRGYAYLRACCSTQRESRVLWRRSAPPCLRDLRRRQGLTDARQGHKLGGSVVNQRRRVVREQGAYRTRRLRGCDLELALAALVTCCNKGAAEDKQDIRKDGAKHLDRMEIRKSQQDETRVHTEVWTMRISSGEGISQQSERTMTAYLGGGRQHRR